MPASSRSPSPPATQLSEPEPSDCFEAFSTCSSDESGAAVGAPVVDEAAPLVDFVGFGVPVEAEGVGVPVVAPGVAEPAAPDFGVELGLALGLGFGLGGAGPTGVTPG